MGRVESANIPFRELRFKRYVQNSLHADKTLALLGQKNRAVHSLALDEVA